MIRYRLLCSHDHEFDSWFDSSERYKALAEAGLIECPHCGDAEIRKALMTPQIRPSRNAACEEPPPAPETAADAEAASPEAQASPPALGETRNVSKLDGETRTAMTAEMRDALRQAREYVMANAEDVGENFAEEARKIHYEEVEPRGIYGQAEKEEIEELTEEGVELFALPALPEDKN